MTYERFILCACSHPRPVHLAMCTVPAITNMPHTHMHTKPSHVHTHKHILIQVYTYTRIYNVCIDIYTQICTHACVCSYAHVFVDTFFVHQFMCDIYIYIYIYIYTDVVYRVCSCVCMYENVNVSVNVCAHSHVHEYCICSCTLFKVRVHTNIFYICVLICIYWRICTCCPDHVYIYDNIFIHI